ncbi:MAG: hypothetical protein KatS3mg076_0447 [Candidatus Binatia bacterium]|nr:MAG: hypothetical protein KatS3mg076_0447 [Candidatus Binatia bacterium]
MGGARSGFVLGLVFFLHASSVLATVFYVAPGGNDDGDGLAPERAFRTIGRAATSANPGDTIVVAPGIYTEGNLEPRAFGHVSFLADFSGTMTGADPGHVVVDATGFDTGFRISGKLKVRVDGFVILGPQFGVHVKSGSDGSLVQNNIVTACERHGIYVQDSKNVVVFNNLVYKNGENGILVTGNVAGSPGAWVVHNTVYGNAGRGIFFSGTTIGSPGGRVLNNVLQGNAVAGIQVNEVSRPGFLGAGNVSADRFPTGTPVDATDRRVEDVGFADSAPKVGGLMFASDRFELAQRSSGQAFDSPAVDAGVDFARRLRLTRGTTRTDGRWDRSWADAGFHYPGRLRERVDWPGRRIRVRKVPLFADSGRGRDEGSGQTPADPLRTLSRSLALARPGHVVLLGSPVFAEGDLDVPVYGDGTRELVLRGRRGMVVLDARGKTRGLRVPGKTRLELRRLAVRGAGSVGIDVREGAEVSIRDALLEENGSDGVRTDSGNLTLERVRARANGGRGLNSIGSSVWIRDSQFVENGTEGISLSRSEFWIGTTSVRSNVQSGVQVQGDSEGHIEGGEFCANGGPGIWVSGARFLEVVGARACANAKEGLLLQQTAARLVAPYVTENRGDGIRVVGGELEVAGAELQENGGHGLTASSVLELSLLESDVSENEENGVQLVQIAGATLSGTFLRANGGDGLRAIDCPDLVVHNNLVADNGSTGVLVSGETEGSPRARIVQNTIVGNANRGLLLGGSDLEPPSDSGSVLRNIFHGNGVADLQVNRLSLPGYVGDYNLVTGPYGAATPPGLHDVLVVDPLFVAEDTGDYRLRQRATGHPYDSPAVDAGDTDPGTAGVAGRTTRVDGVPDSGPVDLGFHYPP